MSRRPPARPTGDAETFDETDETDARCADAERRDCLVCHHEGCGWCPDCSPGVPEWTI